MDEDDINDYADGYKELDAEFDGSAVEDRPAILAEMYGQVSDLYDDISSFYDDVRELGAEDVELKSRDDLLMRLPEIDRIEDDELREEVIEVFMDDCPDRFWLSPSSRSGKHHPYRQRGVFGHWYHTKNVFEAFDRLSRSAVASDDITEEERDYGRAAALVHDLFKYGKEFENESVDGHEEAAATYLRKETDMPGEVIGCVETHTGPWSDEREPDTELERLHHYADMVASSDRLYTEEKEIELFTAVASLLDGED